METYRIYKYATVSGVDYRVANNIEDRNLRHMSHWVGKITATSKRDAAQILKSILADCVKDKFAILGGLLAEHLNN